MKKVILNKCYGCFNVSPKGYDLYAKKINKKLYCYRGEFEESNSAIIYTKERLEDFIKNGPAFFYEYLLKDAGDKFISSPNGNHDSCLILDEKNRFDPTLIEVVEELGSEASGRYSDLQVIEIPDDVANDYMIDNYDGIETLHKRVVVY